MSKCLCLCFARLHCRYTYARACANNVVTEKQRLDVPSENDMVSHMIARKIYHPGFCLSL